MATTLPKFNPTNDNIEWAKWSWNPVTGCKHDCPWCYARDIAMRFTGHFDPEFHPDRLSAPFNTKIPKGRENEPGIRNVFVGSMCDLFGEWVPQEWIDAILNVVYDSPQWTFLFLTKNPERYLTLLFPINCWVGATAHTQDAADRAMCVFKKLTAHTAVNFLSFEPLSERIEIQDIDLVDNINWLIIGGCSKTSKMPAQQPQWQWVEQLLVQAHRADIPVYFKPNLTVRPQEYPTGV